jgi:Zn-dependent protease
VRQGLGVAAPLAMLVKALPLLKFSKVLLTTGSMLVSVAVYAVSFGLSGAVGIVALLLVHELGHWAVLRYKGFGSSAIVFIPFVGAATAMRRLPTNVQDDAEIGLGGPITGTAGAFACLALGVGLHSYFWEVLAYLGLLLNLLNLVPMLPLDGGRIAAAHRRHAARLLRHRLAPAPRARRALLRSAADHLAGHGHRPAQSWFDWKRVVRLPHSRARPSLCATPATGCNPATSHLETGEETRSCGTFS